MQELKNRLTQSTLKFGKRGIKCADRSEIRSELVAEMNDLRVAMFSGVVIIGSEH